MIPPIITGTNMNERKWTQTVFFHSVGCLEFCLKVLERTVIIIFFSTVFLTIKILHYIKFKITKTYEWKHNYDYLETKMKYLIQFANVI